MIDKDEASKEVVKEFEDDLENHIKQVHKILDQKEKEHKDTIEHSK